MKKFIRVTPIGSMTEVVFFNRVKKSHIITSHTMLVPQATVGADVKTWLDANNVVGKAFPTGPTSIGGA